MTPVSTCAGYLESGEPCPAPRILAPHATFADLMSAGLATSDEPAEYAAVEVVGFYRDDPSSANGLCTTAHTTTPYVLRLNFGPLTLKIRNRDSDDHSEPPGIHAVFACQGAIHL